MKLRIEAEPADIEKLIQDFKKNLRGYEVLEVSKPYPNRGSKMVRVYVTIKHL